MTKRTRVSRWWFHRWLKMDRKRRMWSSFNNCRWNCQLFSIAMDMRAWCTTTGWLLWIGWRGVESINANNKLCFSGEIMKSSAEREENCWFFISDLLGWFTLKFVYSIFMREWMFFLLLLTVFMREILPHCVYLLMDYWLMRCGGVVWRAIARLRKAIEFVRLRTLSCTDSDCISRKSPARWNRWLSSSSHYYRTCPADRVCDSSNVLCVMKCWSVAEG